MRRLRWPVYATLARVGNDEAWDRAIAFRSPVYWARDWRVSLPSVVVDMSKLHELEAGGSALFDTVKALSRNPDTPVTWHVAGEPTDVA
jgi:hypothetical protein